MNKEEMPAESAMNTNDNNITFVNADDNVPENFAAIMNAQRKELGEPVVVIRHLSKSYTIQASQTDKWKAGKGGSNGTASTTTALRDIHLAPDSEFQPIRRGEFVILRGPSGGGKTSLLNILGAIDTASGGQVEILNEIIDEQSTDTFLSDLRLRKIGFVFQTFNLLSNLSAVENVELPMTILGKLTAAQRRKRAIRLLAVVGLQDRLTHLPSELSGGEQQRVTIARALANEPEILLLDEPTGDLDTFNTVEIMNLLMRINRERQTTCIMVTHNPDIECYADRLLYLRDGRLEKQAINLLPTPLNYQQYAEYLKQRDGSE